MKKQLTIVAATALALSGLTAQAQIALDGVVNASEIGSGTGQYTSLGAFTPAHTPSAGFGMFGLLRMYGANTGRKFYVALAGNPEPSGNNFQLYMDLPGRTGVVAGTALPNINGPGTVFATDPTDPNKTIGGTKLDMDVDAAFAMNGQGDIQAAIFTSATSAVAKSLGGGAAIFTDGTVNPIPASETTGAYAIFGGGRVAYVASATDISGNPGNSNGGGAGSYALEMEFDNATMGLPSGSSIVHLMAAYVSGDGYWSSDVVPEVTGNGNNNLGFHPDFTSLAGTQAGTLNVVLSTRQADEAVVAMSVFPNPTAGQSTISYRVLGGAQPVLVTVSDLVGRQAKTLFSQTQSAGIHDLKVQTGDLAAGTYLVKVQVGDKVATRKLVVE